MYPNNEILATRKIDQANRAWIDEVDAIMTAASQALAERDFAKALKLAEQARAEAVEMYGEGIETGYDLEHEARTIIAKVQQQTI